MLWKHVVCNVIKYNTITLLFPISDFINIMVNGGET